MSKEQEKVKVISKGSVFTVTCGEYSDYMTLAVLKALKDLNTKELQEEYLIEHPEQKDQYESKESQFLAWLINEKGYAEEIEFSELHIGSYSTADFKLETDTNLSEV